jgi:isoquinoline 1-oxidoreductase alpha subunit
MTRVSIEVNGEARSADVDEDMPLLWFLRDVVGLTGTKYGCGRALCGSCVVHVGGVPVRSCVMPVKYVGGRAVTTIEGLDPEGEHPAQRAWREERVPQCGYCQSGQIMAAVGLLSAVPDPDDDDIDHSMAGNLCRCGTYPRIRAAIHRAAELMRENDGGA